VPLQSIQITLLFTRSNKSQTTGYPLSRLQKNPGLFRTPKTFVQNSVIAQHQQCLDIQTNTYSTLYIQCDSTIYCKTFSCKETVRF